MRHALAFVAGLALTFGTVVTPTAQNPAPPRDGQTVSSQVTAILVDVVVRDRSGRPLTNLTAADFDLAEDGVPHRIDSFSRVSRGGIGVSVAWRSPSTTIATPTDTDTSSASADSTRREDEGATALVFDQLSAESLRLAQKATLDYVPMNGESGIRVGVFATDPGMRVLQGFTTDRALVRRAVAQVQPSGSSAAEQKASRADELTARRTDLLEQGNPSAGTSTSNATLAQTGAVTGQREMELKMIQTELNMIRASDRLDREHRGYDTSNALFAVVRILASYPGRKTIVFFSEGLPASPVLAAKLDTVIDAANRANVTAYAIDANGLRTNSSATNMKKEVDNFAEERFRQLSIGADRTEQPLMMDFERVEDTLRLDSRTGLARLAGDTGGFLVDESNDLSSAFRRIDEDAQFHYLLTYSPVNSAFDGRFRTIQVKVRRPGVQVFARKGYRALRRTAPSDAGGYESSALELLDRSSLPNAFPIHAATFSFPDPVRPGLTPVLVRVGTDRLQFDTNAARGTYSADAAIVVRVRDGQGREAQKASQQYLLTGDAKDVDAARRGEILFYRELDLAPGIYTIESIVFDGLTRNGSARIATLTVPPVERTSLGMSSLVLVKRIEELAETSAPPKEGTAPLYVGKRLLYPNIGEPISRSATGELPFYFVLYGEAAGSKVNAQLLRDGTPLADAPVEMPASKGPRVQHVGRLPIAALPVGTYELRIRVSDGARELSRAVFFTLVD